jgi:hypothetical protein
MIGAAPGGVKRRADLGSTRETTAKKRRSAEALLPELTQMRKN